MPCLQRLQVEHAEQRVAAADIGVEEAERLARLDRLDPQRHPSPRCTMLSGCMPRSRTGRRPREVFVPALAAWLAAQPRPAPPAMLPVALRPALN